MSDVRIRFQHLKARESEIARQGLERYIDEEEKRLDQKEKINRVLVTAEHYAADNVIEDWELDRVNYAAQDAEVQELEYQQWSWERRNGVTPSFLLRSNDTGDPQVNRQRDTWDGWKKDVTRELESLDDGQAIAQIRLQQLNNQMLNADGARTDHEKQTHELEKKIRENAFSTVA